MITDGNPLRVLFLCTGNSARSQMAEALLQTKGKGRFTAASAGSQPAEQVNPIAIDVLAEAGIDWRGRVPKRIDDVIVQHWDIVITVCDRAKESCPILPGRPILAHWGMPDPAAVEGSDEERRRAFEDTAVALARRIDLFVALPTVSLERLALGHPSCSTLPTVAPVIASTLTSSMPRLPAVFISNE